MPKTYTIEVTMSHNGELFGTSREVTGPADLQEFLSLEGDTGVFERALKSWKAEQGSELRAALGGKVKGEEAKVGKRSKAKFVAV